MPSKAPPTWSHGNASRSCRTSTAFCCSTIRRQELVASIASSCNLNEHNNFQSEFHNQNGKSMNSIIDGCSLAGYRSCQQKRLFAALSSEVGLALFIFFAVFSAEAANHGAGIFKVPTGPLGVPKAHVGETITAAIKVQNLDDFGDTITFSSITDIVHHATADAPSANLIPGNIVQLALGAFLSNNVVVLPNKNAFVTVS